jgi:hypothetical protein
MTCLGARLVIGLAALTALVCSVDCSFDTLPETTPLGGDGGADSDRSASPPGPPVTPDASASPSGPTVDVKPDCPPHLQGFAPQWRPPTPFAQGLCTPAQIEAMVTCARDPTAAPSACKVVYADSVNRACGTCLLSRVDDAAYGPLIASGDDGVIAPNVAGCIARAEGDLSGAGCGAQVQAADDCLAAACALPCSDDLLPQCVSEARATVCAAYVSPATCADAALAPGGAAEACAMHTPFSRLADAIRVSTLFCGASPSDAGASGG